MTLRRPIWMQAGGGDPTFQYSAQDMRFLLDSVLASEGVLSGLQVTQRGAGANFSVDISAGHAAILGEDVLAQGMYLAVNDTDGYNVVVPSPPVSGTRVHRIVAQIRDKLHLGSWTDYDWAPLLLEDIGSGTPAVPTSAIPLARVSVAAGQVSVTDAHITDDRVWAQLRPGRNRQVSSDSGRPANPLTFEEIDRTDQGYREVWTGSAWRVSDFARPYAMLRRATAQTIDREVVTAVAFDSEAADSHNGHDTGTNNTRYTIPRAGLWRVSAVVPWEAVDMKGRLEAYVRLNGSGTHGGEAIYKHEGITTPVLSFTRLMQLAAGDYLELLVWHNASATGGGALATLQVRSDYQQGVTFDVEWLRTI